ncbi:hypothetical protein ABG067_002904 [Albugo candida]
MRYLWATSVLHVVYEISSIMKSILKKNFLRITSNGRVTIQLSRQIEIAETFTERQAIAFRLDKLQGKDQWRQNPKSNLYLYDRVLKKTRMYKELMSEKDIVGIMFALRAGLLRKHWGLGHPQLYAVSQVGTKHVIEEYLDTIVRSMNMVLRATGTTEDSREELSIDNKLAFFSETRHAFGRSALLLSGGGALGMYHSGVLKALVEQNMLPTVIAGSSAGSICAGIIGVRTDEEVLEFFSSDRLHLNFLSANIMPEDIKNFIPSLLPPMRKILPTSYYKNLEWIAIVLARFVKKRFVLDSNVLKDALRTNIGDYTFREAYDKTGRIINITVTQSKASDYPHLLNYLTAPNALIWSACLASCAIPIIFPPVELLAKDKTGAIVPYFREGLKWSDGSIECDLPMERLSELFNVNHFIVSQVNLHHKLLTAYGSLGRGQSGSLLGFLKQQMKSHIKHLAEFGLNTTVLKFLDIGVIPLLTQKYEGDITICPTEKISVLHLARNSLRNPTEKQFHNEIMKAGERACWPCISRIRTMCRIEFALERAVRYLKGEQALEDEKRNGKRIGRVPSFYTSPSSINLLSLDQRPSSPKRSIQGGDHTIYNERLLSQPTLRRNRSMNVAGAVMTREDD